MNEEFVRRQLALLPERIQGALETNAATELDNHLVNLYFQKNFEPMHILVVGGKNSYPAAFFARHAVSRRVCTTNVEVATIPTAIHMIKQCNHIINCQWCPSYDLVIAVSYEHTPDIKALSVVCKERGYPFLLLTSASKGALSPFYVEGDFLKIVSYYNIKYPDKEKSRISMASSLIPCILFNHSSDTDAKFYNYEDDLESGKHFVQELDIPSIAKSIYEHPTVHIFYEWDSIPAAVDLKNKFTNSGLAATILHEKGNFSCELLYHQPFGLIINLARYTMGPFSSYHMSKYRYDRYLSEFLKTICKDSLKPYIEIGNSTIDPLPWNIEAMAIFPYLVTAIGEELGIDIADPLNHFPEEFPFS